MLDELDLRIVNALQLHPRVTWAQLAPILHTDPTTISRRWSRMRESGLVWTTAFAESLAVNPRWHLGLEVLAFVEVKCESGRRDDLVELFSSWMEVMTIECLSGEWDMILTLGVLTVAEIDDLVTHRLGAVLGVVTTRVQYVHKLYREGSDWQLNLLRGDEQDRLRLLRGAGGTGPVNPTDNLIAVCRALEGDARRSVVEIATDLGRTPAWVTRAVVQLLQADWVSWRVECSPYEAGWNVISNTWLEARADMLDRVGRAIATHPGIRLCCATVGIANLFVTQWHRSFTDFDSFEQSVQSTFPDVRVVNRALVVKVVKRAGVIIDSSWRAVGYIPIHGVHSILRT